MVTYPQTVSAPAPRGGTDVAAWALVALVVALVCAGAGWAFARQDNPGRDDLMMTSELSAREGEARGMADGYRQGAAAGRRQAAARGRLAATRDRREAARDGYQAGLLDGRSAAQSRADGGLALGGLGLGSSGAYPAAGYEDVLATSLFDDEPGYADSAWSEFGYGSGSSTPYASGVGASLASDDILGSDY